MKTQRRELDFYPTETAVTLALLERFSFQHSSSSTYLECCAGDGAISRLLLELYGNVWSNDIDPDHKWCDFHRDMTKPESWRNFKDAVDDELSFDWVITNPPFDQAPLILPLAYEHARKGMAMLLRLSYVEPCDNRGEWLEEHPPNHTMIFNPRPSFTDNKKTDSVTTAWFVWEKGNTNQQYHFVRNWRKKKYLPKT